MSEAQAALKGLLRSLKEVRAQRLASSDVRYDQVLRGELWGLDTAIKAIERRLK